MLVTVWIQLTPGPLTTLQPTRGAGFTAGLAACQSQQLTNGAIGSLLMVPLAGYATAGHPCTHSEPAAAEHIQRVQCGRRAALLM